MEKEFVTYDIGLRLKELGFDEPCFGYYENGVFIFWYDSKQDNELVLNCTAPTWQSAFEWFYEKYGLFFEPSSIFLNDEKVYNFYYTYCATKEKNGGENLIPITFEKQISSIQHKFKSTLYEVKIDCLNQFIEIVKNKILWDKTLIIVM
jgi:hypothetical protein